MTPRVATFLVIGLVSASLPAPSPPPQSHTASAVVM